MFAPVVVEHCLFLLVRSWKRATDGKWFWPGDVWVIAGTMACIGDVGTGAWLVRPSSYIWMDGEYTLSAQTDKSKSRPFELPSVALPIFWLEGDWVTQMGWLGVDWALGVENACGEVAMFSFACYYRVKLMPKKDKKHGHFSPWVKQIWRSGVL